MDFLSGFSFGCLSTKVHGCIFHNLLFWETALEFSQNFSLQAARCFFQVLVLDTFAVGPKLFPFCWETCIFVAILTHSHSVFCYGFLPGLSLGYVNYCSPQILLISWINASHGRGTLKGNH